MKLTEREVATMLAALRYWQLRQTGEAPDNDYDDIASDGGKLSPLPPEEVDELCEKINWPANGEEFTE